MSQRTKAPDYSLIAATGVPHLSYTGVRVSQNPFNLTEVSCLHEPTYHPPADVYVLSGAVKKKQVFNALKKLF